MDASWDVGYDYTGLPVTNMGDYTYTGAGMTGYQPLFQNPISYWDVNTAAPYPNVSTGTNWSSLATSLLPSVFGGLSQYLTSQAKPTTTTNPTVASTKTAAWEQANLQNLATNWQDVLGQAKQVQAGSTALNPLAEAWYSNRTVPAIIGGAPQSEIARQQYLKGEMDLTPEMMMEQTNPYFEQARQQYQKVYDDMVMQELRPGGAYAGTELDKVVQDYLTGRTEAAKPIAETYLKQADLMKSWQDAIAGRQGAATTAMQTEFGTNAQLADALKQMQAWNYPYEQEKAKLYSDIDTLVKVLQGAQGLPVDRIAGQLGGGTSAETGNTAGGIIGSLLAGMGTNITQNPQTNVISGLLSSLGLA